MSTRITRLGIVAYDTSDPQKIVPVKPAPSGAGNAAIGHFLREIDALTGEIGSYCSAVPPVIDVGDARLAALLSQEIVRRAGRLERMVNSAIGALLPNEGVAA